MWRKEHKSNKQKQANNKKKTNTETPDIAPSSDDKEATNLAPLQRGVISITRTYVHFKKRSPCFRKDVTTAN